MVTRLFFRLLTLSPASHASTYTGERQIAEAVGDGIRHRTVADLLAQEATGRQLSGRGTGH